MIKLVFIIATLAVSPYTLAWSLTSMANHAFKLGESAYSQAKSSGIYQSLNGKATSSSEQVNGNNEPYAESSQRGPVSASYRKDVPESKHFIKVDEGYFTAYVDCADRTASFVVREERVDTANNPRPPRFYYSDKLPMKCQPRSLYTYHSPVKTKYDRGHELDSNSYDYSDEALHRANYMYLVAPQIAQTNRGGSWRKIEKIMECYRTPKYIGNGNSIRTVAGVVWGNNTGDDYFVKSHGQRTPSYYFKIVVFHENGRNTSYAWLVQNEHVETRAESKDINAELVTVDQLVQMTGYNEIKNYVPEDVYYTKASKSPTFLRGCDES